MLNVIYYEDYYLDFFNAQKEAVKKKFNWTLQLISSQDRIPEKFFKHITGSNGILYERVGSWELGVWSLEFGVWNQTLGW